MFLIKSSTKLMLFLSCVNHQIKKDLIVVFGNFLVHNSRRTDSLVFENLELYG